MENDALLVYQNFLFQQDKSCMKIDKNYVRFHLNQLFSPPL